MSDCRTFLSDDRRMFSSRLGRYTNKLQNLFLFQFDPIRDFSLETIFYTLPKLSLVADDEFLLPEWFMDVSQQFHLTFPISVHNRCTILQGCQPGIWRLTGKTEQFTTSLQTLDFDIDLQLLEKVNKLEMWKNKKVHRWFNIKPILTQPWNLWMTLNCASLFNEHN